MAASRSSRVAAPDEVFSPINGVRRLTNVAKRRPINCELAHTLQVRVTNPFRNRIFHKVFCILVKGAVHRSAAGLTTPRFSHRKLLLCEETASPAAAGTNHSAGTAARPVCKGARPLERPLWFRCS